MSNHYDVIAIGAGSGGISVVERAAAYGAKCAVIEGSELGGTCVNLGCVPKKVMWYGANVAHHVRDAPDYGFDITQNGFSWDKLITKRDNYIAGINDWYYDYLNDAGIELIEGYATFTDDKTIEVDGESYTADNIVIATGGQPVILGNVPGQDLGITSDGFFELDEQPEKAVVVGGGYIALELAGVLNALGTDVTVLHQGFPVLEPFDDLMRDTLLQEMRNDGVNFNVESAISEIVKQDDDKLTIRFADDAEDITDADTLLWAIGRKPNTANLGLENTSINVSERGFIDVDEYEQTSVAGVYALGDVIAQPQLTPVAIAAGRRLGDRLYGGKPERKMAYDLVPTVVFTHPPVGTVGLTEAQARAEYGDDAVNVYQSSYTSMYFSMLRHKVKTAMKLVVTGDDEKVVGAHVIGAGADEMMQGFAVAIRMGATKADFDDTIAIHPSSAEELVTMR